MTGMDWEKTVASETTYQRSWYVNFQGQVWPIADKEDHGVPIAEVIASVTRASSSEVVLWVRLEECEYGPLDPGVPPVHVGVAGGRTEQESLYELFEVAERAARQLAMFYATMAKAAVGDLPCCPVQ